MVLGTHPAKPYLRRIWFAPFSCWHFHCTPPTAKPPTSGKHARRLFRRSIRQAISSAFTGCSTRGISSRPRGFLQFADGSAPIAINYLDPITGQQASLSRPWASIQPRPSSASLWTATASTASSPCRQATDGRAAGPQAKAGPAGPAAWDFGPRPSDLGPRTSDVGPRTSDLGPRTSAVGRRPSRPPQVAAQECDELFGDHAAAEIVWTLHRRAVDDRSRDRRDHPQREVRVRHPDGRALQESPEFVERGRIQR